MNRIGAQCQWDSPEFLRFNRAARPRALMLINVSKREFVQQLWDENPDLEYVIWRHHPNLDWQDDPISKAIANVKEIGQRIAPFADLITHVTDNNEFIFDQNHSPLDLIARADRYIAAFIYEAELRLEKGTCWGNFNTGHYDGSFVDLFPLALEMSQAYGLSWPCFHEYDWPTLDRLHLEGLAKGDGGYWLCGRYKRIMESVRERYPGVCCAVTELGVDYGVMQQGDHRGWAQAAPTLPEAVDLYCGDHGLAWYNADLEDYVEFALVFGCGMWDDWRDRGFDIADTEVIDRLAAMQPPENGGNGMEELKVYDLDNNLLTGAAAADKIAFHGLKITQPALPAGQKFLQLVELREYVGPACFKFTVLEADGTPWVGIETAWAWSDNMGDADDILGNNYPTDWQAQADLGPTKEDGTTAPGFGQTGWYHDPYKSGPGRAWIRHPEYWSTLLTGIGMIGATNHQTMGGTWKLTTYTGTTPPPPSGDLGARMGAVITELTAIRAEVVKLGQVAKVKLVMADGSEVEYKPAASVASRALATAKRLLGR